MIKCDRHRALIPESTCIARQRIIQKSGAWNTYRRVASLEVQYACKGCEIGEKLLKGESVMEHQKTKICRVCGQEKAVKEFYVNKAAKDGRESLCKACKTEKRKEREGELLQSSYVARERLMQEEIADQQAKPDTINTSDHNLDQALEQEMWRILEKIRRRVNESDSKKSDPPPDPDDLVRVLLERCGRGDLYAVLSEVAAQQLRPVYMQAVYMLSFELIAFKDKP